MIAERVLDRDGSCSELAELAAVVIASWESDVHPEFARPHVEPGPAPVVVMPAARLASPMAYDAALGASLSHADSFAAGGVLALTWIPRGTGPGNGTLLAAVDAERTLDLGVGRARWRRWMGSAEFDWRLSRIPLDFHGGLVLGWLTAKQGGRTSPRRTGRAFPSRLRRPWACDCPGGPRAYLAVWLDLTGLYWTRSQTVYAEPSGREARTPREYRELQA